MCTILKYECRDLCVSVIDYFILVKSSRPTCKTQLPWNFLGGYPTEKSLSFDGLTDKYFSKIPKMSQKSDKNPTGKSDLVGYPTKNPPVEQKGKSVSLWVFS